MKQRIEQENRNAIWFACIAGVFLLLFFLILNDIQSDGILKQIDIFLNELMPLIRISFLVFIARVIDIGLDEIGFIFLSIILAFFLATRPSRKEAIFFSLSMIFGSAVLIVAKELINRARPGNGLFIESTSSFPSGHTFFAVLFFGMIIYFGFVHLRNTTAKYGLTIGCILIIALTGFSRIYANVHWASDVAAGVALGVCVLSSSFFVRQLFTSRE
jgi:membrane-associated phospholipid phosphatase